MSDVPAGWNQDPSNPHQERWWDGKSWSPDQVRPKPTTDGHSNQFPHQSQQESPQFPNGGPQAQPYGQTASGFQGQPLTGDSQKGSNATLLLIVGGSIALFLVVALVGVVLIRSGDDGDDQVEASGSGSQTFEESTSGAPITADSSSVDGPVTSPTVNQTPTDGSEDVSNCMFQGEEHLTLDITNSTDTVSDYNIDLAYLDASGNRVEDDFYYVSALRPGETAQEKQRNVDPELDVASCEILEVSRRPVEFDQALVDHVSTCEVSLEKYSTKSTMTVTNPDADTYDYSIVIALVGPDGVRRLTSEGYVENVRTNEPTAAEASLYSIEDEEAAGLTCEVVHVERRDK